MFTKLITACISLLGAFFVAQVMAQTPITPHIQWTECPNSVLPSKEPIRCGWLQVPEDHQNPQIGTLNLLITEHLAKNQQHNKGILLINTGGPWTNDADLLPLFLKGYPQEIIDNYNLVAMNPRGTDANAITCYTINPLNPSQKLWQYLFNYTLTPLSLEHFYDLAANMNSQCHFSDLQKYLSTTQTAVDYDWLRQALHVNKISGIGYSAGTILFTKYYQMYPEHSDKFVIDSVAVALDNNALKFNWARAKNITQAQQAFFKACANAKEHCPLYIPQQRTSAKQMQKAYNALLNSPPPGLSTGAINYISGSNYGMAHGAYAPPINQCNISAANAWIFYAKALSAAIDQHDAQALLCINALVNPKFIHYPIHNSERYINFLIVQTDFTSFSLSKQQWLYWSNKACQTYPNIGCDYYVKNMMAQTADIHLPSQPLWNGNFPNNDQAKILIINNIIDPQTPYQYAKTLYSVLKSHVQTAFLTVNEVGHGAYNATAKGNDCVTKQVDDFLLNGVLQKQTYCDTQNPFLAD